MVAELGRHRSSRSRGGGGETDETFPEAGPALFEPGSNEMPKTIPGQGKIPVGGVGHGPKTLLPHRGDEGLPRDIEEGSDETAAAPLATASVGDGEGSHGPDAGQPFPAAAQAETEEHGLHLVVPMVRGHHPAGALASGHIGEETIAHPPSRRLGALSGVAELRHRTAFGEERHPEAPCETVGGGGASGGTGVDTVVQMGRQEPNPGEPVAGTPAEAGERGEQGRGVRTARKGDDQGVTGAHGGAIPEEPVQDLVEMSGCVDQAVARERGNGGGEGI